MSLARILVISTSGLARFVPALGAMAALRAGHHGATIVLLTTPHVADFAAASPYFSEVWVDDTDGTRDLRKLWNLRRRLRATPFDRIYDFDASSHSERLFWLMYGWQGMPFKRANIPWSGTIPGTGLAHTDMHRASMHIIDRWTAQLREADIYGVLRTDISWVARQVTSFNVPFRMNDTFVLVSVEPGPGSAWPAESYAELAVLLADEGRLPVLVGFDPPADVVPMVLESCPKAVDLTGKTSVSDLVFLTWAAAAAVGPDNGIMHLTAAAGCPSVALYDQASDPALVGQRGDAVGILRRARLADIPVGEVLTALKRDRRGRGPIRRLPVA